VVGTKTVYASTSKSYYFLRFAKLVQTLEPAKLAKGAKLFTRIKLVRTGTALKKATFGATVSAQLYVARARYTQIFAQDFVAMTSEKINAKLDAILEPEDAAFIKMYWADIQSEELAEENGWLIGQSVLSLISLADISGITGVVAA
jgi:hypothetical protein